MLKQLWKDVRLNIHDLLVMLAAMAGGMVLGVVMVCIIMHVDADPGSWFCMGTLFCCLVGVVFQLIRGAFGYSTEFQLALAMGCTRREFMVSYFLRALISGAIVLALTRLVYSLELHLYTALFPQYGNDADFSVIFRWNVLLIAIFAMALIPMFLGSLYSRYGKKGMAAFYVIWLFCCFVLPRMFHEEFGPGVLDQVAFRLRHIIFLVPAPIWIVLGLAAAAAMAAATVIFGRTQPVKL